MELSYNRLRTEFIKNLNNFSWYKFPHWDYAKRKIIDLFCGMDEERILFMVEMLIPAEPNESFFLLIPRHRAIVNTMINNGTIVQYAVDEDRRKVWILMKAKNERDLEHFLERLPIYNHTETEYFRLFISDGELFRFPKLHLN